MNRLLEHLNQPQQNAVTHGEGPLLVLAGPGSGKTTVIVKRIQYLIHEMHVPPEEILVITFTKDAAKSMQQRFQEQNAAHDPDKSLPVNFGTFHSIFYHIILQSSYSRSNGFQLLAESRKKQIMVPLLKNIRQREEGNCYTPDNMASDAGELLTAISFYKNTEDLPGALRRVSQLWKPYFQEIFEAYQAQVRAAHAIDFDDMVFECRRMLEQDPKMRSYWQKRFAHILIDEFQDINPMQYQVIRLLTRPPHNLFAVGDDDQAIYGFRGSSPACLRQFAEEFCAEQVILNQNYRSGGEIVQAAGKVIAENEERFAKDLYAASDAWKCPEKPVKILCFQEREEQSDYLRGQIAAFLREHPAQTCAVLFRTNTFMQSFGARLSKAGIPYSMREKARNLYGHFIVRDVMAYLQFAAGDRRRAVFLQFMNKPARFLRRDALADMEIIDFERMKQWYRIRNSEHRLEYLETIDRLRTQLEAMHRMPLHLAVRYLCKAVGYEGWLRTQAGNTGDGKWTEWAEILDWLKEEAAEYESVVDWMEAQQNAAREGKADGRTDVLENLADAGTNAVRLMTVHAAKGLEFDKVWIPDCNEKIFPHGSMPDRESVEEERRIFYVGMTRAKSCLELLCLTGTGERPRQISRFLNPILRDYSSMSSSNSQLSRYSSNASATFSYSSSSSM